MSIQELLDLIDAVNRLARINRLRRQAGLAPVEELTFFQLEHKSK